MRLLLLFLVAFLPIAALTVRAPLKDREADLVRASSEATLRVELAERSHQELMNATRAYARAIGQLGTATGSPVRCTGLLAMLSGIIEDGWAMNRVRLDGVVDCSSNAEEADSLDTFVVQHIDEIVRSDSGIVGPFILSHGTQEPRMPLATAYVRLKDSTGVLRGVLSVRRKLRWLELLGSETSREPGAIVTLVDSSGFVYARLPDPDGIAGTRVTPVPDGAAAPPAFPYEGLRKGSGTDTVARLYASQALVSPEAQTVFLTLGVPSAAVTKAANRQLLWSVSLLAAWVLLTFACALYAAERVVFRDLRALLFATERLGRGDMAARTGVPRHAGELGQMAHAFDRMAEQLEERQARLAQAQKLESVGQLAGGVAHDFNNLLTAIIGNAEIARAQLAADHPARADLDATLDAARRSAQLTRQLLAFAARNTMDVRVLSLTVLLTDITSLLQRLIGEHITLQVSCDPNLLLTRIDPTQFEQLILNLAVNARDAMPTGGTLTIDARNIRVSKGDRDSVRGIAPGAWVALSVRDTGHGMSPEVSRRAFEPFFTTKDVGAGTGLGLAVVYGTVQQHAGHVDIESLQGAGTTVRILLQPSSGEGNYVRPAALTPIITKGNGETVLLVEDESVVRNVTARLLRSNGYAVREAVDGADALEQMHGDNLGEISLLVTDVVMPRLGGPELACTLRGRRPDLPVLLLSGYSEDAIPAELLRAPSTRFLEKPFATGTLLGAVNELMRQGIPSQ